MPRHEIDLGPRTPYHFIGAALQEPLRRRYLFHRSNRIAAMKVKNSLKALMQRDRNNRLVRRKGRVFIINKKAPRYKARQG